MATGPKFVLTAGDEPRLWPVYFGVCADEAERQDSVNLHVEFDDTECEQKIAGPAVAAEETAKESKTVVVNTVTTGILRNHARGGGRG